MEVTAWNSDTTRPTTRLATRTGPASSAISSMACDARWMTVLSLTGALPGGRATCRGQRVSRSAQTSRMERLNQGVGHQGPPVHEDEQQDLEGKREQGGGEYVHPHRHHDRRDDQVDDHERDEDHEADQEGSLQLREDERGHNRRERERRGVVGLLVRRRSEQLEIAGLGLLEHP